MVEDVNKVAWLEHQNNDKIVFNFYRLPGLLEGEFDKLGQANLSEPEKLKKAAKILAEFTAMVRQVSDFIAFLGSTFDITWSASSENIKDEFERRAEQERFGGNDVPKKCDSSVY